MTLEEAVKQRLEARVPELQGRVDLALAFVRLMASKKPLNAAAQVFVLPSGATGLKAPQMANGFTQGLRRAVSLVVMLKATDRRAEPVMIRLSGFLDDIKAALCGWTPGDTVSVFALASERLVSAEEGLVTFLIDFHIHDEMRTIP